MSAVFRRVRTVKTFEDVSTQIRSAILAGDYRPGDRLPSTRELGRQLHVSRLAVLHALRVLESSGLVEILRGARGGAFVRQLDTHPIDLSIDLVASMQGLTLAELADFREIVEGRNAYWAAQRATPSDVASLRAIVEAAKALAKDTAAPWESFREIDAAFHAAVAQAGKNRLAIAVFHGIMPSLRAALSNVPARYKPRMLRDLTGILDGITGRRPGQAEARMRAHIAGFRRVIERGVAGGADGAGHAGPGGGA